MKRLNPEADMQMQIVDYLRRCCPKVIIFCSLNGIYIGAGSKTGFYMAKLKKLGLRTGEPDLRLHWAIQREWSDGTRLVPFKLIPKTLYLELKIKPNKLTPEQAGCISDLELIGFPCETVHSFEEFLEIIKRYGVPCQEAK